MRLIWATRGLTWGFRFLDDGGFPDPLVVYDRYFKGAGDQPEVWHPQVSGEPVAIRFPDPQGRRDDAGRVIPHEFVVFQPDVDMDSFEESRRRVWDQVRERYEGLWARPDPYIAPK